MKTENINFEKYSFQKDGKVWSKYKQGFLNGRKDRDGYTLLELASKDGKFHTYKLHRIIAELFCEKPECYNTEELEVDHIIPLSQGGTNEASNLRWCTPKQNHNNPNTLLNRSKSMRNKKSMSKQVEQVKDNVVIAVFPSTREVERQLGYDHKSISRCCNGLIKQYKGYIWKYAPM